MVDKIMAFPGNPQPAKHDCWFIKADPGPTNKYATKKLSGNGTGNKRCVHR